MKHVTKTEAENLLHDWKYKGYAIVDLLTETEVDEIITEFLKSSNNPDDLGLIETNQMKSGENMNHICIHIKNRI